MKMIERNCETSTQSELQQIFIHYWKLHFGLFQSKLSCSELN